MKSRRRVSTTRPPSTTSRLAWALRIGCVRASSRAMPTRLTPTTTVEFWGKTWSVPAAGDDDDTAPAPPEPHPASATARQGRTPHRQRARSVIGMEPGWYAGRLRRGVLGGGGSARRCGRLGQGALEAEDAADDGDRGGVGRVHAPVGESAGTQSPRLGERGVRRVVDEPEVDRKPGEVDRLPRGIAAGLAQLVERRAVWSGLHLHHGEGLAVVEVEV